MSDDNQNNSNLSDKNSSVQSTQDIKDGSENNVNKRIPTQVDEEWARNNVNKRIPTQVDEEWSKNNVNKRIPTQVDEEWSNNRDEEAYDFGSIDGIEVVGGLDLQSVMSQANAGFFSSIEEFKEEVAKLSEIRSSTEKTYTIKGTVSAEGGESIILLCSDVNGNNVAAKVYYSALNSSESSIKSRFQVFKYMQTEEGKKYTLAVSDIGLVQFQNSKYYFEIFPYYDNLDVSDDGEFSFEKIVEITRQLNNALYSIHNFGIFHRDIKPENLFSDEDGIKLGDFGIAKVGNFGHINVTRVFMGTGGYAAPETRRGVYNEKTDYYSLGITLASLFEGHFIFDNITDEMLETYIENDKLPLKRIDSHRDELENLLTGLCRFSPRQRFGYNDVNLWLENHKYTGGAFDNRWPRGFDMLNDTYFDEINMFLGITKDLDHWNEGMSMLYTRIIENFFSSFRTKITRAAQIVDEYRNENPDKGLFIFLKSLYPEGPIVWKGFSYDGLSDLADGMLANDNESIYCEILQNQCLSYWLKNTEGLNIDNEILECVKTIEILSQTHPRLAQFWFGNSFSNNKRLNICKKDVSNINDMIIAMFTSSNDFYNQDGYSKLLSLDEGADLYGFLYSFGYREFIEKEWEQLTECNLFNKVVVLISMLDSIGEKENIDTTIVREFFMNFGPVGIARYVKKLASKSDEKVYMGLDSDGEKLLDNIINFDNNFSGNCNDLYRNYLPLINNIEKMQINLVDNPHMILAGTYENKGVICTNLMGCFAFEIFDQMAPLGFSSYIINDGGEV